LIMNIKPYALKTVFFLMVLCRTSVALCNDQNISGQDSGAALKRYLIDTRHEELEDRVRTPRDMRPSLDAPRMQFSSTGHDRIFIGDILINHNVPTVLDVDFDAIESVLNSFKGRELRFDELDELCSIISKIIDSEDCLVYIPEQEALSQRLYINIRMSN
jgi:hypothetical protein